MTKGNASDGDRTNRTRRSTGHRVKARAVSLSPDDAVGRDVVDELRAFVNTAKRDDRFDGSLPDEVCQAVELIGIKADKSRSDAFAFCFEQGLNELLQIRSISVIRRCRKAILAADSDDFDWIAHWGYGVASRRGRRRRWWRNIDPGAVALCGAVAEDLGLPRATLATLAVMAMLFQVPDVPDDKKTHFLEEVRRFRHEVERRARRVEELRDRACAIPAPSLIFSFDDVLRDPKQ